MRTSNQALKDSLLKVLQERGSVKSEEAYEFIKKDLNISAPELDEVYLNKEGVSRKTFNTRVQAAVEELRKKGIIERHKEQGLWVINEQFIGAKLNKKKEDTQKVTVYVPKGTDEKINNILNNLKYLKQNNLKLIIDIEREYNITLPTNKSEYYSYASEFYFESLLKPIVEKIENTSVSAEDIRLLIFGEEK